MVRDLDLQTDLLQSITYNKLSEIIICVSHICSITYVYVLYYSDIYVVHTYTLSAINMHIIKVSVLALTGAAVFPLFIIG